MEILTNPTNTTTPVVPPTTATAASQLSSDFEVFLKMLTAQMQYQDPLNPIDSTDYATQLATFSGVEQAVQTNDLLRELTTQLGVGGLTELASWVGKEVRASVPVAFQGQPVTLFPLSTAGAQTWEISVRNAQDDEIMRIPVPPGAEQVDWTGVQFGGVQAPSGTYSFTAIGRTDGQIVGETPVETYSRVTEARLEGGQQVLVLSGDIKVDYSTVTAIRDDL